MVCAVEQRQGPSSYPPRVPSHQGRSQDTIAKDSVYLLKEPFLFTLFLCVFGEGLFLLLSPISSRLLCGLRPLTFSPLWWSGSSQ